MGGPGFKKENKISSNICYCLVKKDENWKQCNDFGSLVVISDLRKDDWNVSGRIIRRNLAMKKKKGDIRW